MADNNKLDYIQEKMDSMIESVCSIDKEVALHKAALESHAKQNDRMYEELKRMNDILQSNTESLKEHMHRSDLLESLMTKMDDRLSPIEVDFIQKAAVKNWVVVKIKFIAKLGTAAATLAAAWVY